MIIYKATNKINGKVYIGQTIRTMEKRIIEHYRQRKTNNRFHNALLKYDKIDFEWEVIEKCNSKDELNEREKYYIDIFNSIENGYNILKGGSNEIINKSKYVFTEERLEKLKVRMKNRIIKDETRKKLSEINKGKKHTEESKNKMSVSKTGVSLNKGKKLSEETKKKISEKLKGNKPWNKGIPCSEESKIKQSLTKRNLNKNA